MIYIKIFKNRRQSRVNFSFSELEGKKELRTNLRVRVDETDADVRTVARGKALHCLTTLTNETET